MITVGKFEYELAELKKDNFHCCYEYPDPTNPCKTFEECTISHFKKVQQPKKYGVYIVRQKYTCDILYIGMSGTINHRGEFKDQNIVERLTKASRGQKVLFCIENDIENQKNLEYLRPKFKKIGIPNIKIETINNKRWIIDIDDVRNKYYITKGNKQKSKIVKNIISSEWFEYLYQEKGTFLVEYILLPESKSPALVEAFLLQSYLNEYTRLPCKNKALK